jgi:crotonobetainyl-CoA:carnitine CoA-transferase CaiB-like acyl-CoA transferase
MVAPYEVLPTRDGALMVAAGNDRLFGALCAVLDLPELVDDARFRTNADRVASRDGLAELLTARLATDDTAAWHERLTAAGVPAAPVADVRDVAESRQTEALGILQRLDHGRIDGLTLPALPLSFDGERALHPSAPPDVGEHSAEILREAGYADEEIDALARDGVVRT